MLLQELTAGCKITSNRNFSAGLPSPIARQSRWHHDCGVDKE